MRTDGQTLGSDLAVCSRVLRALQAQLAADRDPDEQTTRAGASPAGNPSMPAPALDYDQLRTRFRGRDDLIRNALVLFQKECTDGVAELQQLIASGDFDKASDVAHRIKGAAGTVSAGSLRILAGDVETACSEGQIPAIPGRLLDLCREATRVIDQLTPLLRSQEPRP